MSSSLTLSTAPKPNLTKSIVSSTPPASISLQSTPRRNASSVLQYRPGSDANTPRAQPPTSATPQSGAQQTLGNWRHPRLDEIIRRQQKARFGPDEVKSIVLGVVGLGVTWVAPQFALWVLS
ncbi:hypothetical protein LTR66_015562, partial [Elasticomyces elasticus]